ncbi:hypothetical protein D3C75_906710 [compost metagenome]
MRPHTCTNVKGLSLDNLRDLTHCCHSGDTGRGLFFVAINGVFQLIEFVAVAALRFQILNTLFVVAQLLAVVGYLLIGTLQRLMVSISV